MNKARRQVRAEPVRIGNVVVTPLAEVREMTEEPAAEAAGGTRYPVPGTRYR